MTAGQPNSAVPGLAARRLTCVRGERVVFADLEFQLPPGGALILVGPNGSGKSSLLRLLAGLSRPFSGRLEWGGADIAEDPDSHRARLRYAGHQDAVKPTLTALENLAVWAGLDGLPDAEGRSERALQAVALDHVADMPGRYLSAGQKKRINLARLALVPAAVAPLWLLDEPATALDRESLDRLEALLAAHRAAGGLVILSTHSELVVPGALTLNLADFGATDDGDDEDEAPRGMTA